MGSIDVVVYCEAGAGQTEASNASLITAGAKLAANQGGRVVCLLVGNDIAEVAGELGQYVDEVRVADAPRHADYDPLTVLGALQKLVVEIDPCAVLFGHTHIGMDLAARLSAKLGTSLISNCFDVQCEAGATHFLRPMYRGRVNAKVAVEGGIIVATIQQSGARQPDLKGGGQVIAIEVEYAEDRRIRPLKTIAPTRSGVDIAKADIVVAGGRGVGEKENFALVEALAAAVGGVSACSRPLVDIGWFTSSSQVGLSGTTVKPKLYIACGISGAVEHVHGMKESGTIVAINKDPDAPIFRIADIGIVGDLLELLPLITTEVKSTRTA
ncbi:hypothetical protein AS156_18680 [Bradyrhizobium macuxiense]|uniref:Electron transfer flavoprotein alpha/beta-subunit N-terminal domain-containing protein n=1 Tax=Bradyrhizobium macuxiense TaxID=1755647 RepID=A0A120FJ40_9BRAD|nr:electron transfer flavoprotein subunit alpha/FixB family protein [Bradyrhizobium macuxiense]KWV48497.1 hypothetical protein AS156_18680 [Bradyrhizobium macuxiense]